MKKVALLYDSFSRDFRERLLLKSYLELMGIEAVIYPGYHNGREFLLSYKPDLVLTGQICESQTKFIADVANNIGAKLVINTSENYFFAKPEFIPAMYSYGKAGVCNETQIDFQLIADAKAEDYLKTSKFIKKLEKYENIGFPRLDLALEPSLNEPERRQFKRQVNLSSYHKIVTFMSGFVSFADRAYNLSEDELAKLRHGEPKREQYSCFVLELLDQVAEECRKNNSLLIIKRHPWDTSNYLGGRYKMNSNVRLFYEEFYYQNLISLSDLVLHMGSTTVLDCWISNTPSALVMNDQSRGYVSPIFEELEEPKIRCLKEFLDFLNQRPSCRPRDRALIDFKTSLDGLSCMRLALKIAELINICIENKGALRRNYLYFSGYNHAHLLPSKKTFITLSEQKNLAARVKMRLLDESKRFDLEALLASSYINHAYKNLEKYLDDQKVKKNTNFSASTMIDLHEAIAAEVCALIDDGEIARAKYSLHKLSEANVSFSKSKLHAIHAHLRERKIRRNPFGKYKYTTNRHELLHKIAFMIDCGKLDDARESVRALKAEKLNDPVLELFRVKLFLRANQHRDALEAAREASRQFPEDSNISCYLQSIEAICPPEPCPAVRPGDEDFKDFYARVRSSTMLSGSRLYNLYRMAKKVCLEDLEGNFAECGVAGGGGTLLLALVVQRYSKRRRKVYAFDTFAGMPEPDAEDVTDNGIVADQTDWSTGTCFGSLEFVGGSMRAEGVADIVVCVPGLFEDTLLKERESIGSLALLHADGSWYQSVKQTFEAFYDLVVGNGLVQVNDYGYWRGCAKAVDEFFAAGSIDYPLRKIDKKGIWFQKAAKRNSLYAPQDADPKGVKAVQLTQPDKTNVPTQLNSNERYQVYSVLSDELPEGRNHVLVDFAAYAGGNLVLFWQTMELQRKRALLIGVESQEIPVLKAVQEKLGARQCRILRESRLDALAKLEASLNRDEIRPDFILLPLNDWTGVEVEALQRASELLVPGGVLAIQDFSVSGLGENSQTYLAALEHFSISVLDKETSEGADWLDALPSGKFSRLSFYRKRC